MTPDPAVLLEQIREGTLPTGAVTIDQDFLKEAADMGQSRLDGYALFAQYYDGEQKTRLPDRVKQYLERDGQEWSENFCETVVDTFAGRMAVAGFRTSAYEPPKPDELDEEGNPVSESDPAADWLQTYFWEKNRMDSVQTLVHFTAIQKGDSFLLLDYDNERKCPRATFNRPEVIKPEWGDDGKMEWVAKRWDTSAKSPTNPTGEKVTRLNVYYPERVEKYFQLAKDGADKWSLWLDDDDTSWPTPWIDSEGKPLGIPVFHFANKPTGRRWGRSELKSVIPQQDVLNKQILDLLQVMDTMGYPQRWATGVSNPTELKTAPGEVWSTEGEGAQFGQFDSAPLDGALNAIDKTLQRLSGRSRTPAHLLVTSPGGAPSGEALKTAESGIVSKAKYNAIFWGDVWADVGAMALRLAQAFGAEDMPPVVVDELTIHTNWEDPETRNLLSLLMALSEMKDLGVSERTILTMIPGVDADQEIRAKEMDQTTAGGAVMDFIDRGAQRPVPVEYRVPSPQRQVAVERG